MGKWLFEDQHKELTRIAGETYADLVDADKDFVNSEDASAVSVYTIAEMLVIMDHVYLLGMLYCGGQRREFVQMMDLEVRER